MKCPSCGNFWNSDDQIACGACGQAVGGCVQVPAEGACKINDGDIEAIFARTDKMKASGLVPDSISFQKLDELRTKLLGLSGAGSSDVVALRDELAKVAAELEQALQHLQQELLRLQSAQRHLSIGFERELDRTTKPFEPPKGDDKYKVDWKPPDSAS
jgi:hypothetical protein